MDIRNFSAISAIDHNDRNFPKFFCNFSPLDNFPTST